MWALMMMMNIGVSQSVHTRAFKKTTYNDNDDIGLRQSVHVYVYVCDDDESVSQYVRMRAVFGVCSSDAACGHLAPAPFGELGHLHTYS